VSGGHFIFGSTPAPVVGLLDWGDLLRTIIDLRELSVHCVAAGTCVSVCDPAIPCDPSISCYLVLSDAVLRENLARVGVGCTALSIEFSWKKWHLHVLKSPKFSSTRAYRRS